jgi:hypothetical protein
VTGGELKIDVLPAGAVVPRRNGSGSGRRSRAGWSGPGRGLSGTSTASELPAQQRNYGDDGAADLDAGPHAVAALPGGEGGHVLPHQGPGCGRGGSAGGRGGFG